MIIKSLEEFKKIYKKGYVFFCVRPVYGGPPEEVSVFVLEDFGIIEGKQVIVYYYSGILEKFKSTNDAETFFRDNCIVTTEFFEALNFIQDFQKRFAQDLQWQNRVQQTRIEEEEITLRNWEKLLKS